VQPPSTLYVAGQPSQWVVGQPLYEAFFFLFKKKKLRENIK